MQLNSIFPNINNTPANDMPKSSVGVDKDSLKELFINFLTPLLCLSGSVLLFLLVIYPAINDLPNIRAELQTNQNLRDVLATKLSTLNKLVDFQAVVSENSSLVDKVLLSEAQVLQLSTQVNKIAAESGLKLTRLSYSYDVSTSDSTQSKTVALSMGAEGTYDQLVLFLKTLENASRMINVSNFRFMNGETQSGGFGLTVSFSLASPYISIQSAAVTDDPINLDIASPDFVNVMNAVKSLKYYEITQEDINALPVPATEDTEETPEI